MYSNGNMQMPKIVWDILANVVATTVLYMTPLPDYLQSQPNRILATFGTGASFTISNDLADWYFTGRSRILSGEFRQFVDESIYNGSVFMVIDQLNLDDMVNTTIKGVSPFGDDVNRNVLIGSIAVGMNTLRDFLQNNYSNNQLVSILLRPTSLIM